VSQKKKILINMMDLSKREKRKKGKKKTMMGVEENGME